MVSYLFLLVPKKPQLTTYQFKALVDMAVGAGLVSFGSIVVPALFDKSSSYTVVYGVTGVVVFWTMALWFSGKIYE
ncbi:hypothetical protein KKB40_04195 [Patescibacteria group bacterium]|nr:hypothetical protein [Patescibacteria group bacterium]